MMVYDVLLEQIENNGYTARLLAWPEYVIQADTREAALAEARLILRQRLSRAEVVQITAEPGEENPWVKFAGMWADDHTFDEFVAEMEKYRCEFDADEA